MKVLAKIFGVTVGILQALLSLGLLAAGAYAGVLGARYLAISLSVLLTSTSLEFWEPAVVGCILALKGVVGTGLAGAVLQPMRRVCALVIRLGVTVSFLPAALLFAFTGLAVITGDVGRERLEHMLSLVCAFAALAVVVRVALNLLDDSGDSRAEVSIAN